jgi:hypothetical protein
MRSRACATKTKSAGLSGDPSVRVTTRIADTMSPPGNWLDAAATLAESDELGTDTGDWLAELFAPVKTINAADAAMITRARSHERRPATI